MRYVALIHVDEAWWEALPDEEQQAVYAGYRAFAEGPHVVEGDELRPTSTATTVRVKDGERLVTDGPFAELREQIAGYFVLECDSMEEAVALAARIPGASHGAVEVRPAFAREEEAA